MTWTHVVTDEVLGHVPARALVMMTDRNIAHLAVHVLNHRIGGGRGEDWDRLFRLNSGMRVLDFGCGLGVEAIRLVRMGCRVDIYDIQPEASAAAERACRALNHAVTRLGDLREARLYDAVYANGVIHHMPHADEVMAMLVRDHLVPGGTVLLGLHTRQAWTDTIDANPPMRGEADERCVMFGSKMDAPQVVFAEPWWPEKIEARWPFLELISFDVLAGYPWLAAARLKSKAMQ